MMHNITEYKEKPGEFQMYYCKTMDLKKIYGK